MRWDQKECLVFPELSSRYYKNPASQRYSMAILTTASHTDAALFAVGHSCTKLTTGVGSAIFRMKKNRILPAP